MNLNMKIILPILTIFLSYISFGQTNTEIENNSVNSVNYNEKKLNTAEKQKLVIDYVNHFVMKDTTWFIDHIIPLNYFVDSILESNELNLQDYFYSEINFEKSDLVNCCYDSINSKFLHKKYENEVLKTIFEFWEQFDTCSSFKIGKTEEQLELNNEHFQSFDFYGVEFTYKSKTFEVEIPKLIFRKIDSKVFYLKPPPVFGLMQVVNGATFIGGEEELYSFIYNNLKYPNSMKVSGKEGKVEVELLISDKGLIKQSKIIHSLSKDADEAVLNLIKKMPKWEPAIIDGKEVESMITIPIVFSLDN